MKKLITISLFLFSLASFAQTSGSRIFRENSDTENWRYSKEDDKYISYGYSDTIVSPNNKYKVVMRAIGIQDQCSQLTYWLLFDDRKEKIMTAIVRDISIPNFFWIGNEYLLYEMKNNHDPTKIRLQNLTNNKIEVDTSGSISIPQKYGDEFYDPINNVFIFYKSRKDSIHYKTDIMKLELNTKAVKYLGTLKADGDYLADNFEYPVPSMDWTERKLYLNYHDTDKEYNDEIKY